MQRAEREENLSRLLLASQKGDMNSYNQFLIQVSELLAPFISKKVTSPEFIDDILQDTLLAIHNSRHTYLPERSVMAWINVICEHRIIDFFRKFRRLEKREISTLADVEHEIVNSDSSERLEVFLEKIPMKQREVIEMLKLQGLSIKEVSAKTGMSESAVKVTAFRGYEAMKRLKGIEDHE